MGLFCVLSWGSFLKHTGASFFHRPNVHTSDNIGHLKKTYYRPCHVQGVDKPSPAHPAAVYGAKKGLEIHSAIKWSHVMLGVCMCNQSGE